MKIPQNYVAAKVPMTYTEGVNFLNANFAGWYNEIDTTKLKLDSCSNCVIGQLFRVQDRADFTTIASKLFGINNALFDNNSIFGLKAPDHTILGGRCTIQHTANWKRIIKKLQKEHVVTQTVEVQPNVELTLEQQLKQAQLKVAELQKAIEKNKEVAEVDKLVAKLENTYSVFLTGYEIARIAMLLGKTTPSADFKRFVQVDHHANSQPIHRALAKVHSVKYDAYIVRKFDGNYDKLKDVFTNVVMK